MLARAESVDGDGGVGLVGGADRDCLHLGVVQSVVVVHDGGTAAVLLCSFVAIRLALLRVRTSVSMEE